MVPKKKKVGNQCVIFISSRVYPSDKRPASAKIIDLVKKLLKIYPPFVIHKRIGN